MGVAKVAEAVGPEKRKNQTGLARCKVFVLRAQVPRKSFDHHPAATDQPTPQPKRQKGGGGGVVDEKKKKQTRGKTGPGLGRVGGNDEPSCLRATRATLGGEEKKKLATLVGQKTLASEVHSKES